MTKIGNVIAGTSDRRGDYSIYNGLNGSDVYNSKSKSNNNGNSDAKDRSGIILATNIHKEIGSKKLDHIY